MMGRRRVPAGPEVWVVCREMIPAGSVFAFLAEHRRVLFPSQAFADMYAPVNGRPSVPPGLLATVVVLQALRFDLRWKAACGLGLYDQGFDPSLLTCFRRRLARSSDPGRIFTAVRTVVERLSDQNLDETAEHAVGLLALIAGQDVEPANGSDGTDGRWRIARRTAPDRIVSTVDVEARHIHKSRQQREDGYKAHLAVEPETGLFTAVALRPGAGAAHHESAVAPGLLADEDGPLQILADAAYAAAELRASLTAAGHQLLIKPPALTPAVIGGFTLDDFAIDTVTGTVTCPAGHTVPLAAPGGRYQQRRATFTGLCAACPLRERCTTAGTGRVVTIRPHHDLQAAARHQAATDSAWQDDYRRWRPMVERAVAWLVARGNRRLRYRGTDANDHWLHHRAAALNLRRLINLGLTRTKDTWTLAPISP